VALFVMSLFWLPPVIWLAAASFVLLRFRLKKRPCAAPLATAAKG
jgi:hypothetical protein